MIQLGLIHTFHLHKSVIDNIECLNIVTTKTIKLNTKLHIAMFALDKEKA